MYCTATCECFTPLAVCEVAIPGLAGGKSDKERLSAFRMSGEQPSGKRGKECDSKAEVGGRAEAGRAEAAQRRPQKVTKSRDRRDRLLRAHSHTDGGREEESKGDSPLVAGDCIRICVRRV